MIRALLLATWALATTWGVLLYSYEATPLAPALLLPGSYLASLFITLALAVVIGASLRDITRGLGLGAAATTITGPMISLGFYPELAYPASAMALGLAALSFPTSGAVTPLIAGATQAVCLIVLVRRQFGLSQSQLETDLTLLLPMLFVWAIFSGVFVVRGLLRNA